MKSKRSNMVEASWELFLKTGDPFYFMAKNTFEDISSDINNTSKEKIKEDGINNCNKGDLS